LTVSLPVGVSSIAVTDFSLYGNQDPPIGANLLDFSQNPFTGAKVSGVPTAFTLTSANPSITFAVADYPGLATSPDRQVGWSASFDGVASVRGLQMVPEPSTLALLGLGALSLLACDGRRRKAKA
jgi:hypothetical protein